MAFFFFFQCYILLEISTYLTDPTLRQPNFKSFFQKSLKGRSPEQHVIWVCLSMQQLFQYLKRQGNISLAILVLGKTGGLA